METTVSKVNELVASALYEEAENVLMQKLRESGNNPDVLAMLGHVCFDASDYSRAKSFFEQALFFDRENKSASAGILRLSAISPVADNREELLSRLKGTKNSIGYLGRAGFYCGTGKIGLAVKETEEAVAAFPDDREIMMARIDALIRNNVTDPVIGELIGQVKAHGADKTILDTEMIWLYRNCRYEECLACCEAVEAEQTDASLLKRASELKGKIRKPSAAGSDTGESVAEEPRLRLRMHEKEAEAVPEPDITKAPEEAPVEVPVDVSGSMAEETLQKLIGLDSVKQEILKIKKKIEFNRLRQERLGVEYEDEDAYHFVFSGNPGTGKTTVARLLGEILCDAGLLDVGQLIEVERSDLVGEFQGETAKKTREAIEQALGGILFVDEAYSLINGENDNFGHEALDTLVKGVEDHRKDLVVILAGYKDEMRELIETNIGLESRFTRFIEFPDYTEDELLEIAKSMAATQHYVFSSDGELAFREKIARQMVNKKFGNARSVRTLMNEAYTEKALGFDPEKSSLEYMTILTPDDFGIVLGKDSESKAKDALLKLDCLTGLKDVKFEINSTVKIVDYLKQERAEGNADSITFTNSLHMCFAGNPGTGKTTVARIYAELLAALGIAKTGELIEASRGDLVGRYQGETALKTKDVCERSYGGVLFIDEAYDLVQGENDTFGHEAVAELIKQMEDHRDKMIVIFAGYSREMDAFMDSNSGIKSRLSKTIVFPDYSEEELCLIFDGFVQDKRIIMDEAVTEKSRSVIGELYERRDARFGNAREMRNLFEAVWRNMVNRVETDGLSGDARRTFEIADFENARREAK